MKYKDFEGTIEELIKIKLEEIERVENVIILHAVESGSRAWGFASPDSDYDVRFIYVRPKEFYLNLEDSKDTIDWELDETLDINGWDLRKALKLFYKSNSTLFEWANSPIVYRTTELWNEIYHVAAQHFSKKACMYHYYGTAKSNYHQYLQEDKVKYKKYFYVIRPLLACKWIEKKECPAPVLFDALKETMLDDDMKAEINNLLKLKVEMNEGDKGERIDKINHYIEEELNYYTNLIAKMMDDKKKEWDDLNKIFLKMLN